MAKSFLDKVRSEPPTPPRMVMMLGADPDIHTMGLAFVTADIAAHQPFVVRSIQLYARTIRGGKKGLEQAVAAASSLHSRPFQIPSGTAGGLYAVIESQQMYADRNAARPELISKAEDLLKVAHVSGALQHYLMGQGYDVKVVVPATWKGQRKKEVDHKATIERCGQAVMVTGVFDDNQDGAAIETGSLAFLAEKPRWEHAMDALGMTMYGLDLFATNRWGP